MAKKKTSANVQVTGRAVAYIQDVKKGNKLGKARPVVLTTVRVAGQQSPAATPKRRRKPKR